MNWTDSLKEIHRAKNSGRLVIFVGAGVSRNSGLPTWSGLIAQFADKLHYEHCSTCADSKNCDAQKKAECNRKNIFTQEEFLRIPEYYYQKDERGYYELVNEVLNKNVEPNEIDNEILRIAPQHIITTNYDDLLERSDSINTGLYSVIAKDQDLLAKASSRYIVKMHGDFNDIENIVLKESDYINYEHNYILISTFIKSLLINNTFMFVGYSLSDYNLNLIIGWINYFAEVHKIEERPKSFILVSDDESDFEKERLARKNIIVVETNTIEESYVDKYASSKLQNDKGRRMHAFLRLISDDAKYREVIASEIDTEDNYKLLSAYNHIAYIDLKRNCNINNLDYMGNTLVFSNEAALNSFEKAYNNSSTLQELIGKTCITEAQAYHCKRSIALVEKKETDTLFQKYLDNDFTSLQKDLEIISNPEVRLYYMVLLGSTYEALNETIAEMDKGTDKADIVEVLLSKMRKRSALLYLGLYRAEQLTKEITDLFASLNANYKNATGYLYKLHHSENDDRIAMQKTLEKQESHYRYKINGFITGHAFQNIWKLQSYAYEYYFFFKENYLPIDHYKDVYNYLYYYLKAILCSYSPVTEDEDTVFIGTHREHYPLEETDLDMFVKYTDPKSLKKWIDDYHVSNVEFVDGLDVCSKFRNLCESAVTCINKYIVNYIYSFSILITKTVDNELRTQATYAVLELINKLIENNDNWIEDIICSKDLLDAIILLLKSIEPSASPEIASLSKELIQNVIAKGLHKKVPANNKWAFQKVFRLTRDAYDDSFKTNAYSSICQIEDVSERLEAVEFYRMALPMDRFSALLTKSVNMLSTESIFNFIFEGYIEPSKECEQRILAEIEKLHIERITKPGMRTFPDYLQSYIDDFIILHLVYEEFNIYELKKYAGYSKCIQFFLAPSEFDYSQVDTSNYMWTNIIKTERYQHFFIDHKKEIIGEIKEAIKNNIDTRDQQKILFGLLTPKEELWNT